MLSKEQTEIVQDPTPRILVKAVAGSGKTMLLVHRYSWMVQEQGIHPGEVAIVTYTRKAAKEFRGRIELMGLPQPAWIGTVHAWSLDTVKRYMNPDAIVTESPVVGEPDLIEAGDPLIYRAAGFLAVNEHLRKVRHVLWDEVQDTGHADLQFLTAIAPETEFAVGDPNQAIFGFVHKDGSVMDWIGDPNRSKPVKVFGLTTDWRNPPCVAKIASGLTQLLPAPVQIKVAPGNEGLCQVVDVMDANPVDQVKALVEEIQTKEPMSTIAVLVSSNRLAAVWGARLGITPWTHGVPYGLGTLFKWARVAQASDEQIARNTWLVWDLQPIMESMGIRWKDIRAAKTVGEAVEVFGLDIQDYVGIDESTTPQDYQTWYLDKGYLDKPLGKLVVMTVHSAKGREWDHVILTDQNSFTWLTPEEKRKIYYVAVTRARRALYLVPPLWGPFEKILEGKVLEGKGEL